MSVELTAVEHSSTPAEKLLVCGMAFGLACAGFLASAVALVPITAALADASALPTAAMQVAVLCVLALAPIVGAVCGIELGGRAVMHARTQAS